MRPNIGERGASSGFQEATKSSGGAHYFHYTYLAMPVFLSLRLTTTFDCLPSQYTDILPTQQRANILKEVQIMRQMEHPNIVQLIDFDESKQHYFIILELAPGGELFHQIVRLTFFSEDLSKHVITQVAQALEYLHEEKGVVHRYVSQ
jgi:serine/threonine protein kinase